MFKEKLNYLIAVVFSNIILIVSLATESAYGASIEGVTSKKKFTVDFAANTRDIHISLAGRITDVKVTPKAKAPDSQQTNVGNYSAAWDAAPGAGEYMFNISRIGAGGWNFKHKLTIDGKLNTTALVPGDFGVETNFSIYPLFDVETGIVSIFGENELGVSDVLLNNIIVSVISDQDLYFNSDWFNSFGPEFVLGGGILPSGSSDVSFGTVPFGPNDWIKITALSTNETKIFGNNPIPEPASVSLLFIGLLTLFMRNRSSKIERKTKRWIQLFPRFS